MKRIFLAVLAALTLANPCWAQTSINARQVTVNGTRLDAVTDSLNAAVTQASSSATAQPATSNEYATSAATFVAAAKPLIKFVPPSLRAQLLAGANGPSAPDFAPYIQKALEQGRVVDLQGLQVNVKTPIDFIGFEALLMNGGRLWANMTNPSDPVFRLKVLPAGQQVVAQLYVFGFGSITGSATVFSAKMPYVPGNGLRIVVNNITANGLTRAANTRFMDAELIDFAQVRDSSISNYDQAFRFTVPSNAVGIRGNTQLILEGLGLGNVNSVAYIDNSDLVRFNVDAMNIGGGVVIGDNTYRLIFDRFHAEAIAYIADWKNAADEAAGYSKFGWGVWIKDGLNYGPITFNQGSIFGSNTVDASLNPGTPIGGVYVGKHDNGTAGTVTLRDFYIAPTSSNAPNWIPIEAHYSVRWEGKWPAGTLSNVRLGNSGPSDLSVSDQYMDIVVDEGQFARRGARNLLPGTKLINLTDKVGPGTVVVSEYSATPFENAHQIAFTASANTEQYRTVTLNPGWHTLLISGARVSGNIFASVRTADDADWPLRKQFQNASSLYPTTFHMPFYAPRATTYRVGIEVTTNASAIVDEIGLVKGFWPFDVPPGAWTYPPVTALPTCSARTEGRGYTLLGASNDNHVYICKNTTSGYAMAMVS
jgi:hypothetical protein